MTKPDADGLKEYYKIKNNIVQVNYRLLYCLCGHF